MADAHYDLIAIRDLLLRCIVGINPEERIHRQDVVVNVILWADLRAACASDRIDDTIDYKGVKDRIVEFVEESSCNLVEHLAQHIADLCLEDPRVHRCEVTVEKPGALRFARSVAVTLSRGRPQA